MRRSEENISSARILYGVVVMLTSYGLVFLIWQVISVYLRTHFSSLFG